MKDRHIRYNRLLRYIEDQQKNDRAFVIRPKHKSDVGRVEKDKEKLKNLYLEGYEDARECFEELQNYLEEE